MPALKPLPSPARVAANRQNATQSTGPKTDAGKVRSRGNALKHGLAGAGIALPIEDEAAVEQQFAAIQAELAPTTALGAHFARRVAVAVVRAERAVRYEAKALSHRVRHAAESFDRERRAVAEAAFNRLDTEPRAARRELLARPEGVDLLIETLLDLRACVARAEPDWSVDHEALLRNSSGWRDEEIDPARGFALSRAILGDPRLLGEADRRAAQTPVEPGTPIVLGLLLAGVIEDEIDLLRDHRATLDHEAIALDRAEAAERATFDPGRDATLARRYEAAAVREVRQALDQFRQVEAAPTPEIPPAEPIEEAATFAVNSNPQSKFVAPLASFGSTLDPSPGLAPLDGQDLAEGRTGAFGSPLCYSGPALT